MTWGALRRREDQVFASLEGSLDEADLVEAHWLERELAEMAFKDAGGESRWESVGSLNVRDAVERLNEVYVEYGISSGMKQTGELVRSLQSEAARQAGPQR